MAEVRLTAEEAEALRAALPAMVIRSRTGELGVMHGAERFVSTQRIFRKADREALNAAARKLGLGVIREYAGVSVSADRRAFSVRRACGPEPCLILPAGGIVALKAISKAGFPGMSGEKRRIGGRSMLTLAGRRDSP